MPDPVEIVDLRHLLELADLFEGGECGFDVEAVRDRYAAALEAAACRLVPSVSIDDAGRVFAAAADVEAARGLDWSGLAATVDGVGLLTENRRR